MSAPEPPWLPFFRRAEAMATSAFRTIPLVGDAVADYFTTVIVPVCSPPRDRILSGVTRCLRGSRPPEKKTTPGA